MLEKYVKLCDATNHFRDCSFKAGTRNLIPTFERSDDEQQSEHEVIIEMTNVLKEFEIVSMWLQTENSREPKMTVNLYTVRKVFDRLCSKYPFVLRHLSSAAEIVHEPLFESAVAKIQGNDFSLTMGEKRKVSCFLIDEEDEDETDGEERREPSFLDETLDDAAAESCKRRKKKNPYRSMDHISPTSNIVERLFSRCGIIMRPHRRLMDPSTLEMLVMLRFNKDLWDACEVNEAMKRLTTHATETLREGTASTSSSSSFFTPISRSSSSSSPISRSSFSSSSSSI